MGAGVGSHAVQQRDPEWAPLEEPQRPVYVGQRRHAAREYRGKVVRSELGEEAKMVELGARHLHGFAAQASEQAGASQPEGRAEEKQAPRLGISFYFSVEILVLLQLEEAVV